MLKSFIETNRNVYETALKDTQNKVYYMFNGRVTARYVQKYWSTGSFEGYTYNVDGKEFDMQEDEMKAHLFGLGYVIEEEQTNTYKFVNTQIWEEYQTKLKVENDYNDKIKAARKEIRRKTKEFIFNNYPKLYIRFGLIPNSGRSYNYRDNFFEKGISVYEAVKFNNNYYVDMSGNLFTFYGLLEDKEAYIIDGTTLKDRGSDNEPLLTNAKIISKIDKQNIRTVDNFITEVF